MYRCVSIEFDPAGTGSDGRPMSYEPRKWMLILAGRVHCHELDSAPSLRERIRKHWLSEFKTSLNLVVRVPDNSDSGQDFEAWRLVFIGARRIQEFGTPQLALQLLQPPGQAAA